MKRLSKEEMKMVTGGIEQTNCGVYLPEQGGWRRLSLPVGEGAPRAQEYVANGWATAWCCDSCPDWSEQVPS